MEDEWSIVDRLAGDLETRFGPPPEIAIVLGSGLGDVADALAHRETEKVASFGGWPHSTVEGHQGTIHLGSIGSVRVAVLQGRVHLYEGHEPRVVVRPIRALVSWGAKVVVLTNAAGGIDPSFDPGQLMVVEDHLNLTGKNPLLGPNDDRRGLRFPDLSELYDQKLRELVINCAKQLGIRMNTGVYAGLLGPTYETPAEVRMLARFGAQAVGMSTVLEAIAAKHLGARIAAISCISNRAAGLAGAKLDHAEVQRVGKQAARDLARLLPAWIALLGGQS